MRAARGAPAQRLTRTSRVARIAPVVAGAVADEALQIRVGGDSGPRERRVLRCGMDALELRAQRVHDLDVRALAEPAEVVPLARHPALEREQNSRAVVLHVEPVAHVAAVA